MKCCIGAMGQPMEKALSAMAVWARLRLVHPCTARLALVLLWKVQHWCCLERTFRICAGTGGNVLCGR